MDLNKAFLVGNVGSVDEIRSTQQGSSVIGFSVATNERWKDKTGQLQEKTEWHYVVAWRKTAEFVNEYVRKGTKLWVEGKIQTRSWETQEGVKKYKTEIVADRVGLLSRADKGGSQEVEADQQSFGNFQQEDDVP